MQWNLEFPEENDDNSISWNSVCLDFPHDSDDDSNHLNFGNFKLLGDNYDTNIQPQIESQIGATRNRVEEPPLKQTRLQEPYGLSDASEENHADVDMLANDDESSDTDSHPGILVDDGEQPGTSHQVTNDGKTVDSSDNEIMDLDSDSNLGVLANEDSQPGTSSMANNQNGGES